MLQRYADNTVVSSLAAACIQTATLPLQAVGSLVGSFSRFFVVLLLGALLFTTLVVLSNSSVYAYSTFGRMYNAGVAPVVGSLTWLSVLLDFVWRLVVPVWNASVYLISQLLQRLLLPYSVRNLEVIPELLQALTLSAVSLAQSVKDWLFNVHTCTLGYRETMRVCGIVVATNQTQDCSSVFTQMDLRCYATPNFLSVDLLTPGLFARQAALALQRAITDSCGVAALVLNLLVFPLCDHQLYIALHSGVNMVLFTAVGLPISTSRRCRALEAMDVSRVVRKVGCTPDWQPVAALAESALARTGDVINNWLDAAAVLTWQQIFGAPDSCDRKLAISEVVLDAARAIEGVESVEALLRLQGQNGMPQGETVQRVRVVGLTPQLFGVSDGKSVLYRSPHDGYVVALGAWPFQVNVQLGLAAVTYGGSLSEADNGDARTGLLGCLCVDEPQFALWCATAPYVQHIDDELAGLNASSVHKIDFPGLDLTGLKCASTHIRVMPLRWPRRRMARAEAQGSDGNAGYSRFSYTLDATDNLRVLASSHRAMASASVEAAIYVQPVCGGHVDASVSCARTGKSNCYPWCMGVVRGGRRAQNISMYNMHRWEEHVIIPDVDCVVRRHSLCGVEDLPSSFIDVMAQTGVVQGGCSAQQCTPHAVPAAVTSLLALSAISGDQNSTIGLIQSHKNDVWLGVRSEKQPFVVAGDVMLHCQECDTAEGVVVVTRLYDIGQGTLQVASERLTLLSNAKAVQVASCDTVGDAECVAQAMYDGKVVLPLSVREVRDSGVAETGIMPHAAVSRWAVHWAENPEISVYSAFFEFCYNSSRSLSFLLNSGYNSPRVWTMQTMRSVDMEQQGEPSAAQVQSRVSYMRVPSFLDHAVVQARDCNTVVGLRIEGVEYLNEQNILVTVVAARPRDYNPRTGVITGPRTHRYYYLHPNRHDCVRTDAEDVLENNPKVFSCWRPESRGMWPEDEILGSPVTYHEQVQCSKARVVPAFGSAIVMPWIVLVRVLETALDAICVFPALLAANPRHPAEALEQLFTMDFRQSYFHGMVDSAGARLLNVDEIIVASRWLSTFFAHLMVYLVNGVSVASKGVGMPPEAERAVTGLRTLVVGGAKVYEGMPRTDGPLAVVEKMFREPLSASGHSASMAVLTMADNLQGGSAMNPIVGTFLKAQLLLVSTLELTLRLGRVVIVRFVQSFGALGAGASEASDLATAASAVSVLSGAVLESRAIVQNDWLDLMRFQCYGISQMFGSEYAWGQTVRSLCLLTPDTIDGILTVVTVLVIEYPVVNCACKLDEGDVLGTVNDICLRRPMPVESTLWMLQVSLTSASRQEVCFAAMDSANSRLQDAFNQAFRRLYDMTRHAAQIADGLLALVTGDTVACDAWDMSPYVLSIIPEPVDYFMSCINTDDCTVRCLDEISAFNTELQTKRSYSPGMISKLSVPLESLLFNLNDMEKGANQPPFLMLDVADLPREACLEVCTLPSGRDETRNRCLLLAGLHGVAKLQLAVAYYCLPMDITQYAYQWPQMLLDAQPAAGSQLGFAVLQDKLRALFIATCWTSRFLQRDSLIALVQATVVDQEVAKVLWFLPAFPARELFRTSLRAERDLDLDESPPLHQGFLSTIEYMEVDSTDTDKGFVVFRVYGYRMQKQQNSVSWNPSSMQCIECFFRGSSLDFEGVSCYACLLDGFQTANEKLVFAQTHMQVCLKQQPNLREGDNEEQCQEMIALPRPRAAAPNLLPQDNLLPGKSEVHTRVRIDRELISRRMAVNSATINVFRNFGAYMDMQQQVHARSVLVSRVLYPSPQALENLRVSNAQDMDVTLEIPLINGGDVGGSWMHVLALRLQSQGVTAAERNWLRAETTVNMIQGCSILECGACAYSSDTGISAGLFELQNLCYAAQQCGIERCAGTLVNMRKPLCNLGNVLVGELHAIRVLLQGMWGAVADNIAMVVELTHARRHEYRLKWPEDLVRKQACTAKDTIVSTAASITSIFGSFSHLMQDVGVHHGTVGANVDSRVHARYIMVLTATTNLLSSVMLWPVYQGLVLQKFFACTADDISYTIENLVADTTTKQPTMTIRFGDTSRQQAIESAGIAVCLSQDVRQSLQDAAVSASLEDSGGQTGTFSRDVSKITQKISDAISNSVDLAISSYIQYKTHLLDVWLTWGISVLRGVQDVAQTLDWQNCKLPVVDIGLQSLGLCACGDKAYSIPKEAKDKEWTQHAFWCSGLLMLNEGDGSDLLVWNPFSLQQLLELGSYDEYLRCLRLKWDESSEYYKSSCELLKPKHKRLEQQGVDVMQVIGRCRTNYQQSRWDEAAVLYSLFTVEEWTNLDAIGRSESAKLDDKYVSMRKHVVRLIENDRHHQISSSRLLLPRESWQCLEDALHAGVLRHNCHRAVIKFEYVSRISTSYRDIDACKAYASDTLHYPRFLWAGSSSNHGPLAKLHPEILTLEARRAKAHVDLQKLLDEEIRPAFEELLSTEFAEHLREHLDAEAFSVDGDELHQLVDCVVMGPYSSADLNSNVHLENTKPLPVPQYHRGDPHSRRFSSSGGSQARTDLLKTVFDEVNERTEEFIASAANEHMRKLASVWLELSNFFCICADGEKDLNCCDGDNNFELRDTTLSRTEWDLQNTVLRNTYSYVVHSDVLRVSLWTTHTGTPTPLTDEQRLELEAAQFFAQDFPVHTYSAEDTEDALNKRSLWETCTSRVAGLFSTMPFTVPDVNSARGRDRLLSEVHVREKLIEDYDPVEDYDHTRMHAMEVLVDGLLERSQALAPHFWTYAHRYVPTDSVWCEDKSAAEFESRSTPPVIVTDAWEDRLRPVELDAPHQADLLYPAQVLQSCACGWWKADGCYIPQSVCDFDLDTTASDTAANDENVWVRLCDAKRYKTRSELLFVLRVLRALPAKTLQHENCSSRRPSLSWGLLSPAEQESWYAGDMKNWTFDAQHLASSGPAGLRLGMLSLVEEVKLEEYVQGFKLGEDLRDTYNAQYQHTIGQPVCQSNLNEHLRDDLRKYFVDTFVPMAHAVQIVPAVEYCSRWVLEYAMLAVLQKVQETGPDEGTSLLELLSRQEASVQAWRGRCAVQMHEIGLCTLRGVYDIVPANRTRPNEACAFAGHVVSGCQKMYYTSSCLLYCDGEFYDPCLCAPATECDARPFHAENCTLGLLVDGRKLLSTDEVLLTSSLQWPTELAAAETDNATHYESLQIALQHAHSVSKIQDVDFESLFTHTRTVLLARPDEESVPHTYCDDLLDYWPDVQHPVGYHPTTACSANETNTRGFDAWMSRDEEGTTMVDPVRMRNMTQASQVFGASHLVCDAHAYAAPGHALNPYWMQSKWNPMSEADPAMPWDAPEVDVTEMSFVGEPSNDPQDTTLRASGHTADLLLAHSVGLVRAWAHWFAPSDSENDPAQQMAAQSEAYSSQRALDTQWPHWLPDEKNVREEQLQSSGFFLARAQESPTGCAFPRLVRCTKETDCRQAGFACLLNHHEEENSRKGVCMQNGTCYQHAHCGDEKLCSGEGECVEPQIFVTNAAADSEVQLFGRDGCHTSMQRLSRFEAVPDFAQANGMCNFRNWYHYLNSTSDGTREDKIIDVKDKEVFRTNRAEGSTLLELKVLQPLAHPCDRSYTHTDFKACAAPAVSTRGAGDFTVTSDAQELKAARTWQLRNDAWHARFCSMNGGKKGFLNPYKTYPDTLKQATRDIRRCIEFGLCPETQFHVLGEAVEGRRVQVQIRKEDAADGVHKEDTARDYCSLDAQRCWAVGYLLGEDCVDVAQEKNSELCVVDMLVLPLFRIVYFDSEQGKFPETTTDFENRLLQLRDDCELAFKSTLDEFQSELNLFIEVYKHLTKPYAWTDSARRSIVTEHANSLLLRVFGHMRGFSDLQGYIRHSKCAVYLARRLSEGQRAFAEQASFQYYPSSRVDPVLPGSSLYLLDRRFPVSINLMWLMQCVILAKDSSQAEGGVSADFETRLRKGLSTDRTTEHCQNYNDTWKPQGWQDSQTLALKEWLRRAPFLFTQTESAKLIHPQQFRNDIVASVSKAVSILQTIDMPDLTCVSAEYDWEVTLTEDGFEIPNGRISNKLHRFRLSGLEVGAQIISTDATQQIFAAADSSSIYKQVVDFLVSDTQVQAIKSTWNWDDDNSFSFHFQELLAENILEDVLTDLAKQVRLTDRYAKYSYVKLHSSNMDLLQEKILKRQETASTYLESTAPGICACTTQQGNSGNNFCDTRRTLRVPEYSRHAGLEGQRMECGDLKALPCSDYVRTLIDLRKDLHPPFLSQDEMLYLVLLILQYEISYTATGGFTPLHKVNDPQQAQYVSDMYKVPLADGRNVLSLHEAQEFNLFLDRHEALSMKCQADSLDYFEETNDMHRQLRHCKEMLEEPIGWLLSRDETLTLKPHPQTLYGGFFLSFMEQPTEPTFLNQLTLTQWHEAAYTSTENAICHSHEREGVSVMAPFWGEYFDVAEMGESDRALGCDFKRSSTDSMIMVYDTLCARSGGSAVEESCLGHPNYLDSLENILPAECKLKDGQVVVRRKLGALKEGSQPLCDRQPHIPASCGLKHGALNGRIGKAIKDLTDDIDSVVAIERGFWNLSSSIFRGVEDLGSSDIRAIALDENEIAGHCLHFEITTRGILRLRAAQLASTCNIQSPAGKVQSWLNAVEEEWAWDHAHTAANIVPEQTSASWKCPLHWLQQFHDDNSKYQARSPSWQRNSARFEHITVPHKYAHPTVRHANKIRGVRAPRFLSDELACVAAAGMCHGEDYLRKTLTNLLRASNDFRKVEYVPEAHPECPRVLDWPVDCGKSIIQPMHDDNVNNAGKCFMRQ